VGADAFFFAIARLSGVLWFPVSDQPKDEQYPIQKDHRSGIKIFFSI
jgi:hypothetical protein